MSRNNPYISVRHMLDNAREALGGYEALPRLQQRIRQDMPGNEIILKALPDGLVVRTQRIGRATHRVPHDFRALHPQVPWTRMENIQDEFLPEYNKADYDKMYEIIREEIPPLIAQLEAILAEDPNPPKPSRRLAAAPKEHALAGRRHRPKIPS